MWDTEDQGPAVEAGECTSLYRLSLHLHLPLSAGPFQGCSFCLSHISHRKCVNLFSGKTKSGRMCWTCDERAMDTAVKVFTAHTQVKRGKLARSRCSRVLSVFPKLSKGFPGGTSGKELSCQCRRHKRHEFDPWVRKMPWRRAWQSAPVFLPGESHGQRSLAGCSPQFHRVRHNWSDSACTHAGTKSVVWLPSWHLLETVRPGWERLLSLEHLCGIHASALSVHVLPSYQSPGVKILTTGEQSGCNWKSQAKLGSHSVYQRGVPPPCSA